MCQLLRGAYGGHFLEGLWPAGGTAPYSHHPPPQAGPASFPRGEKWHFFPQVKHGVSSPRVGPGWMPTHRPHLHSIHKSSSPYHQSITHIIMCPHLQIHKPSSRRSCVLISLHPHKPSSLYSCLTSIIIYNYHICCHIAIFESHLHIRDPVSMSVDARLHIHKSSAPYL